MTTPVREGLYPGSIASGRLPIRLHHPDIDIRCRTVTFTLTTHSEGAITHNDVDMAGFLYGQEIAQATVVPDPDAGYER
jgi:hypothetical protein